MNEITLMILDGAVIGSLGFIIYRLGNMASHIRRHCDVLERMENKLWDMSKDA